MSQLEPLIADLALILMCAGVMTLLFKRLRQPVVLGYIVAGFLTSPNMPYMPSVTDMEGIHLWSDIGVIFLLFAVLGIILCPRLRKRGERMTRTFMENLNGNSSE